MISHEDLDDIGAFLADELGSLPGVAPADVEAVGFRLQVYIMAQQERREEALPKRIRNQLPRPLTTRARVRERAELAKVARGAWAVGQQVSA